MKISLFNQFRLTAAEQNLGVYGIHLYQEGKGSISHRFRSNDRECLYSASKTFCSVAVGICQDEGKLRLSDPVISYFPEFEKLASSGSEKITLRDLLHMAAGKDVALFSVDEEQYVDWAELFFKDPMQREPGEKFFYANACTYMLGRVVEKVSGKNLREFLMPKLFEPLEIFNPQWETCPTGHTIAATGLYLTTEELSRMGRLLLQNGVYHDRQIVSAEYVSAMQNDIISTAHWVPDSEHMQGYGYQVWRCTQPGVYRLDGMYGQFSVIDPEKKAVATVTAHNEKCPNDIVRAVLNDVFPLLD